MKKTVSAALLVSILSGCAVSRSAFYENRHAVSDTKLCHALAGNDAKNDADFSSDLHAEASRRGLSTSDCETKKRNQALAVGAGVLLGAAIIAVAKKGGGGYYAPTANNVRDTQWEWDEFRDESGYLVWACRGVQSGRFSDQHHCNGKFQSDYRWPGK